MHALEIREKTKTVELNQLNEKIKNIVEPWKVLKKITIVFVHEST